jgi:prepilin peptidase CpaA
MGAVMLPGIILTIGLAALVDAVLVDLQRRIVPNRNVLLIAVCGLSLRLWFEPGLIWLNLLAAASVLLVLGLLAHHEWIGGGDVKLISAVTLLFPLSDIGALLLGIAISGGVMGVVYLVIRETMTKISNPQICLSNTSAKGGKAGVEQLISGERLRIAAGESMPYAVAVLGSVIYLVVSEAIQCLSATFCLR